MEKEIELAPAFANDVEHRLKLARLPEITGHDHVRAKDFRQRPHIGLSFFVEVSDGKISAHFPERLCAAVGDAVLIGDADNEAAFSLESKQSHGVPPSNGCRCHPHSAPRPWLRLPRPPAGLLAALSDSQAATILQTAPCRNPATVTGNGILAGVPPGGAWLP